MDFQFHLPDPDLASIVQYFWTMEISASANNPFVHRCLAHTAPELIFHCDGHFNLISDDNAVCFSSGIQAQHHSYRRFTAITDSCLFGIRFHHHTIREVFGIDAAEFTGSMPELHHFLGKSARYLEDSIVSADSDQKRITIISDYLKKKLTLKNTIRRGTTETIKYLLSGKGNHSIAELASYNCLSERQFERNFLETTGMSPKLFSRITRFRNALNQTEKSLTHLAVESGYYDQSHFIREFKLFSGYNPTDYFSGNLGEECFTV